jgi:hypothetical protein
MSYLILSFRPIIENEYDRRYKAYHTSYCAAMGLVEYEFLLVRGRTTGSAISSLIRVGVRMGIGVSPYPCPCPSSVIRSDPHPHTSPLLHIVQSCLGDPN